MPRRTSRGACAYCGREFAKGAMSRHLEACPARAEALAARKGTGRIMRLVVEGRYNPEYWMQIEIPASSTLAELDAFLRETWLECCGHLSAFQIGGQAYTSYVDDLDFMDDRPMYGVRLSQVLRQDLRFHHEYDFGTTTDLTLRVVGERKGPVRDEPITVLARNTPPEIACNACGKPATRVCSYCLWEGTGWICDDCVPAHHCGDEALLPVVNSPRVGMCGYAG